MSDARRHHAARTEYIFVPIEIGSPKERDRQRPGQYKRNQPEHWRPAQRPPSKAEKVASFLDGMRRSDQAARDFMAEARRISAERQRANRSSSMARRIAPAPASAPSIPKVRAGCGDNAQRARVTAPTYRAARVDCLSEWDDWPPPFVTPVVAKKLAGQQFD